MKSESDERIVNNVIRHEYRVLTEIEKDQMRRIKDMGLKLYEYMDSIGTSRELNLAKTNLEQSVMWAVKHVTG